MKRVYSGRSVIALVLLASAATACAVDGGGSGPDNHPSPPSSPSTSSESTSSGPTAASGERSAPAANPAAATDTEHAAASDARNDAAADAPASDAASNPASIPQAAPSAPAAEAGEAPTSTDPSPAASYSVISGLVTDNGDGTPANGLGGLGTLASAATVQVSQVVGGVLKLLGEADVSDGKFEVKVPLGLDNLIAQVLDATGHVVGSVLVGASGKSAKDVVVADPVTSETSLESVIMLDASGCDAMTSSMQASAPALSVEISALIDPQLVSALTGAVSAGADVDVLLQALTKAVLASLRVQTNALASVGMSPANMGNAAPNLQVRVRVAANLAFASTLSKALAGVANVEGVVFAALHSAAQLEAKLTADVVKATLEVAGATQDVVDAAVSAGDQLLDALAAATNVPALKQARLDYLSKLVGRITGNGNANGGLLGQVLTQTTGVVNSLLGGVLDDVSKLTDKLDSTLASGTSGLGDLNLCVDLTAPGDLDATLEPVLKALEKFVADVQALGPSLVQGNGDKVLTAALTDLLSSAELLLRGLVQ